jgi:hypothetical protein
VTIGDKGGEVYTITLNRIFLCAINKIVSAWEQDEISKEGKMKKSFLCFFFNLLSFFTQLVLFNNGINCCTYSQQVGG